MSVELEESVDVVAGFRLICGVVEIVILRVHLIKLG